MSKLIEISINGDIYFFQNNLSEFEYKKLYEFTISYLKKLKDQNENFSAYNYICTAKEKTQITLKHCIIDKVISI